ncbi:hypothetical protein Tco_1296042, partial [Tanacetum coccineum]
RVTHSSRSYRSSDHRRSRCHSLEYDRREGREVSRRYTDDKDYRDRSEPSPRQGRDNRDYDIKRSRYQSSRTPGGRARAPGKTGNGLKRARAKMDTGQIRHGLKRARAKRALMG